MALGLRLTNSERASETQREREIERRLKMRRKYSGTQERGSAPELRLTYSGKESVTEREGEK